MAGFVDAEACTQAIDRVSLAFDLASQGFDFAASTFEDRGDAIAIVPLIGRGPGGSMATVLADFFPVPDRHAFGGAEYLAIDDLQMPELIRQASSMRRSSLLAS
ncbi:hypothetical protein [Mesorhizobium shangrilense]|uniref:Uncharacterized protein n=1 Tax=Mesorhizobium shangrilense TaxID=460060 RepID=A0ABV2DQC0_9HYPH